MFNSSYGIIRTIYIIIRYMLNYNIIINEKS